MTKKDLVSAIVDRDGLFTQEAELAVHTVFETIIEALSQGEKVQITGFGTFEVKEHTERTEQNPTTSKIPVFEASKGFKAAVNT